jgi:ArsR family transcriptional regulator, arsenate/arsenite/antimonite-responsive transcriptional repressor
MEFKCCAKNSQEDKGIKETYSFLGAISDANRLKIICILKAGPKCECEIFPAVGISQKLASHHLLRLTKVGILKRERDGNFIRYELDKKAIKKYKELFNKIIR